MTNRSDYGGDPDLLPIFHPVMHFQWDSNSLLLYSPGGKTSLGGGNALHLVLSRLLLRRKPVYKIARLS